MTMDITMAKTGLFILTVERLAMLGYSILVI